MPFRFGSGTSAIPLTAINNRTHSLSYRSRPCAHACTDPCSHAHPVSCRPTNAQAHTCRQMYACVCTCVHKGTCTDTHTEADSDKDVNRHMHHTCCAYVHNSSLSFYGADPACSSLLFERSPSGAAPEQPEIKGYLACGSHGRPEKFDRDAAKVPQTRFSGHLCQKRSSRLGLGQISVPTVRSFTTKVNLRVPMFLLFFVVLPRLA